MENTDKARSNSHTSDIYLLTNSQRSSNYSKLSPQPSRSRRNPHTHTHTEHRLKKALNDRCGSRPGFIFSRGMHQGSAVVWDAQRYGLRILKLPKGFFFVNDCKKKRSVIIMWLKWCLCSTCQLRSLETVTCGPEILYLFIIDMVFKTEQLGYNS